MKQISVNRRQILSSAGLALGASVIGTTARATYVSSQDGFAYEVTRSPEEWRAMLGEETFKIMRDGETEVPKSSPLWNEARDGTYICKGCDLHLYSSHWKVPLEKGWVFFEHAEPNSVLTGIDWPDGVEVLAQKAPELNILAALETHCRRCGSHMGHIVLVKDAQLHCINGAGLVFQAA